MTRADRSFIIATRRNNNARLTPPAASSAASSNSDLDRPRCPGHTERISTVLVREPDSALSGGDFQGMGSFDPMKVGKSAKGTPALYHRLDEPTQLSLGIVASLQSPLPFRWAESL